MGFGHLEVHATRAKGSQYVALIHPSGSKPELAVLCYHRPPLSSLHTVVFFNTLFGSLNHFGQNVLHLVPKQKERKKKEEENYISEMRYLNRLCLKQESLVIERKETGKSLYDFAMVVLILMSLHGLSLKTSLRGYLL